MESTCLHMNLFISQPWWPLVGFAHSASSASSFDHSSMMLLWRMLFCFQIPTAWASIMGLKHHPPVTRPLLTSARVGPWPERGSSFCLPSAFASWAEWIKDYGKWLMVFYQAAVPQGDCALVPAAQILRVARILVSFLVPLFHFAFERMQILSINSLLGCVSLFLWPKTLNNSALFPFLRWLWSLRSCTDIILLQAHHIVVVFAVAVDLGVLSSWKTSYKEVNAPIPFSQAYIFLKLTDIGMPWRSKEDMLERRWAAWHSGRGEVARKQELGACGGQKWEETAQAGTGWQELVEMVTQKQLEERRKRRKGRKDG